MHAELTGGRERRLRVCSRRVKQGQHPDELPLALALGAGHAQRPKAARRECVDRLIDLRLDLRGVRRQVQNDLRRALGHPERAAVRAFDRRLGALTHRVKRLEMNDIKRVQRVGVAHAAQDREIDRVVVIGA